MNYLFLAAWLALPPVTTMQVVPPVVAVPRTLVFVADGSGNQTLLSGSLCDLAREHRLPLCVERVAWSRTGVGALDLHDRAGRKAAADCLAARVLGERACDPCARICLVGHSAGAHVVLAAAGTLPEGCVQRVVLLAPAVSRRYDLEAALRASCEGVDSFHARCDPTLLAVEVACLTADGRKALTAGRVGFVPHSPGGTPYGNLRQHPYEAGMKGTGHWGSHYGCTRGPFLLSSVVPLLLP